MEDLLSRLHQVLLNKGLPFVRFSMPNDKEAITLISFDPQQLENLENYSDFDQEGFLFAPFVANKDYPIWLFNADEVVDEETDIELILDSLAVFPDIFRKEGRIFSSTSKTAYSEAFKKYLEALKSAQLDKAILSKIVMKERNSASLFSVFNQLTTKYPSAFSYFISLPSGEIWMGATPELLLSYEGSTLKTMALAGTQIKGDRDLADIVWQDKEIEEQAYVRNYVQSVLGTITDKIDMSNTYTSQAGNIVHLRTDFKVSEKISSASIISLIQNLHPTPAVCGIPLDKSRTLILETESHNRAYYTGFLGPIQPNMSALFVNLRCMQVFPQAYALYVGGGITRDSDLENEWQETEAKAQTLLSVID